jgi:hypothetical protein
MAVMGNGDIVVGKNSPTRSPKTVIIDHLAKRPGAPAPTEPILPRKESHCGAMSQQRGDSGAVSTPQKFVRLVGCHDDKPGPRRTR